MATVDSKEKEEQSVYRKGLIIYFSLAAIVSAIIAMNLKPIIAIIIILVIGFVSVPIVKRLTTAYINRY